VDHSIGAIPMTERKLCASVDGNICWVGEIHQILLNDFSMQMSPETINYGGKKPRFRRWTVFCKNVGFGVGFGYCNNTSSEDSVSEPSFECLLTLRFSALSDVWNAPVFIVYRMAKNQALTTTKYFTR